MNHDLLGVAAGILSLAAYALYILTTLFFGKKTKPERTTWLILTLVGLLVAESYYSSGAEATIWIALSYFVGPLIIAIISLNKKYGVGGWGEGFDKYCLVGALIGSVASIVFRVMKPEFPEISLGVNIAIDFIGILPTIKKSYSAPETEDKIAWFLTFIASAISMAAIEVWHPEIWVYPVYLAVMNGLIFLLLVRGKWNIFYSPRALFRGNSG